MEIKTEILLEIISYFMYIRILVSFVSNTTEIMAYVLHNNPHLLHHVLGRISYRNAYELCT
jgi:hypothetical protein